MIGLAFTSLPTFKVLLSRRLYKTHTVDTADSDWQTHLNAFMQLRDERVKVLVLPTYSVVRELHQSGIPVEPTVVVVLDQYDILEKAPGVSILDVRLKRASSNQIFEEIPDLVNGALQLAPRGLSGVAPSISKVEPVLVNAEKVLDSIPNDRNRSGAGEIVAAFFEGVFNEEEWKTERAKIVKFKIDSKAWLAFEDNTTASGYVKKIRAAVLDVTRGTGMQESAARHEVATADLRWLDSWWPLSGLKEEHLKYK